MARVGRRLGWGPPGPAGFGYRQSRVTEKEELQFQLESLQQQLDEVEAYLDGMNDEEED